MNILSLGAGVQSSTLALMYATNELKPMPDAAIFADTGWEPQAVMDWLDWLEKQLPFPVYRVIQGEGIRAKLLGNGRYSAIPFFTENGGMGKRQCTMDYKITPIHRKLRELLGYQPRQRIPAGLATMLIGISTDEAVRMKPSRVPWITHQWPLIDLRMSRGACLAWMENHGYPMPPKSSCLGCPYHSDRQWIEIKNGPHDEWEDVIKLDRIIRRRADKMDQAQYMHRSLKPIDQVDFSGLENNGDMFGNECDGMCGV